MSGSQKISPCFINRYLSIVLFAAVLFSACKKDDDNDAGAVTDVFYRQMLSLTFEVAYEPGAEPYATNTFGENIWSFTEMNIESLFIQRPLKLDVIVPQDLNEMTLIPAQNKSSFSAAEIISLANRYRFKTGNETNDSIFTLFLDGYFRQNDTVQNTVMGVHVSGTTIIAIFKPLIVSSHNSTVIRQFVEQSVVIHEAGHALGLVNIGLPLASEHEDEDHPAHCHNDRCVMYWQNERSANILSFTQNYLNVKRMIFGAECVADVTSYFP